LKGTGGGVSSFLGKGKARLGIDRCGGRQPGLFTGSRSGCRIPRKIIMMAGMCKVTRSLLRVLHKAMG
jgi:hypothetical protein